MINPHQIPNKPERVVWFSHLLKTTPVKSATIPTPQLSCEMKNVSHDWGLGMFDDHHASLFCAWKAKCIEEF